MPKGSNMILIILTTLIIFYSANQSYAPFQRTIQDKHKALRHTDYNLTHILTSLNNFIQKSQIPMGTRLSSKVNCFFGQPYNCLYTLHKSLSSKMSWQFLARTSSLGARTGPQQLSRHQSAPP